MSEKDKQNPNPQTDEEKDITKTILHRYILTFGIKSIIFAIDSINSTAAFVLYFGTTALYLQIFV